MREKLAVTFFALDPDDINNDEFMALAEVLGAEMNATMISGPIRVESLPNDYGRGARIIATFWAQRGEEAQP